MPTDKYNEVVILTISSIIVFLVIVALVIFILLFYQKKKFLYHQQLLDREKHFSEQLLKTQLEMQEQTFNTISQEIHDNVGQTLSLAKVQLSILEEGKKWDEMLLADTKESLSKAMADLRDIAKGLNSERVKQSSLYELINQELTRIGRSGLLLTEVQTVGKEQSIPSQKKLIVFRIVQEALQNILKHAGATRLLIHCEYEADCLQINVTDNGRGFEKSLLADRSGLGLQNIMNQAALIGGTAHIDSTLNEGTTITIITPYV